VLYLVILAAITKRAQIPFSAWLPAAIAAPTPVSALVHSSTLVTAGVYLLIRFNELLGINKVLLLISVTTIFISGLGANFEFDLKKIIALSTLSQLGVIIIVLSIGFYELAFFHLISHAIFKSLLFLCAGFFIHSMSDSQDIRLVGKIVFSYPLVRLFFIGCSLSLCGFPFLAGFYSKDMILENYFFLNINMFLFYILLLGTIFTVTYSVRLIYFIYFKNFKNVPRTISEHDSIILTPIIILFLVSVIVGAYFRWAYLPPLVLIIPLFLKLMVLRLRIILGGVIFINFLGQIVAISYFNFKIY